MANTKRKRDVSARPKTETAEVASPYTSGKTDRVERISDTLISMYNRRQISQLQYSAGDKYRTAFQMLEASAGGSMDFDRARGSSGQAATPALTFLLAAEIVHEVKHYCYPTAFPIVQGVCLYGMTIEQVARRIYERDPIMCGKWESFQRKSGDRFRDALEALAHRWWPDSKVKIDPRTGEEIRPMRRTMTERATVTDAVTVAPSSSVAHATRDKIYRGPQRREKA